MNYNINEIFTSIQGEGIDTGKVSTFVRLAGCNLSCSFCDTNFMFNKTMDEGEIVKRVDAKNVVITGGEPLLQNIVSLVAALAHRDIAITIETNGTFPISGLLYAHCSVSLSPKVNRKDCQVERANSLKVLYPFYNGITPLDFIDFPAKYKSIQVVSPDESPESIKEAIKIVRQLPAEWRLGIQLHKMIGVK